jgi:TolA-binding protein
MKNGNEIKNEQQNDKTAIDIIGIIVTAVCALVTVVCTIVSIIFTCKAMEIDNELKNSVSKMDSTLVRIETLDNKMDLAIKRIGFMIDRIYTKIDSIANDKELNKAKILEEYLAKQPNYSKQSNIVQIEKIWKNGIDLFNKGNYLEAIDKFQKVAIQDSLVGKEAYYIMASAYANLSKDFSENSKQEFYRCLMLDSLKKAARLGNKDAQCLLKRYEEDW